MRKQIPLMMLCILLLIPFFIGCRGAHPATDDFTFATYTYPTFAETGSILRTFRDGISYTLRTWRDWQGTMTGVLVMTLNPAVFSLDHYGIHAVILLLLHILSWIVFLHHFLAVRMSQPRRVWVPLTLGLIVCSLVFLPDIVEGIFWFNGAWFYTGAQAISLLTLTLCDTLAADRKRNMPLLLLAFLLLAALGLDNYITAMMTAAALLMLSVLYAGNSDGQMARNMALFLIPVAAGLILSVLAPGNKVRMAVDGAHESGAGYFLLSIGKTLRAGLFYTLRFLVKTPLLAILLFLYPALPSGKPGKVHWSLYLIAYYLILCAMIFPHMYSSDYAGSGRVINMYHDYVLIALPIFFCRALGKAGLPHLPKKVCFAAGAAALVLCAALGQWQNYAKLVSDQLTGVQRRYEEQFQNEYALCEAAGPEDDVVVPEWTVQTVTGKPTLYPDPTVWTNESMANYFGVRSIRSDGKQEN